MIVKIQGGGNNDGVYANTGSCAQLLNYLEHEDQERLEEGLEVHEFFNGLGVNVTRGEVLQKIDRNHKKLHYADAKFYHLDINPSQDELRAMGTTNEEIVANCKILAVKLTELYAKNFNKQIVEKDKDGNEITRPLSGKDIMIFWKIHETRDKKEGLQIHLHGIPSRKDKHNKYQLSPVTNHRGTSKGPVTGGFERTKFYKEVEKVFDETFNYDRKQEETFEYCLAKKEERKAAEKVATMIKDLDKEKGIEVSVPDTKIKDALAKRDQRRRNEFWNDYHSKYRPMYNELKAACDNSFSMYKEAKEQYGICSAELTDKYNLLREKYAKLRLTEEKIKEANTAKNVIIAVAAVINVADPFTALLLLFVTLILKEAMRSDSIAAKRRIWNDAAAIRDQIRTLQERQAELRCDKTDRLKVYVENKDAKIELQNQINNLKAELDKQNKTSKPKVTFDFKAAAAQKTAQSTTRQAQAAPALPSVNIYSAAINARTREEFSTTLLSKMVSVEPMVDRYGGVADFKVTFADENRVVNASGLMSPEQLRSMLAKWETWTKQVPSYKLTIERNHKEKLVDICKKLDQALPVNAPRTPKNISFRSDGSVESVSYINSKGQALTLNVDTDNYIRWNNGSALNIITGRYYAQRPQIKHDESHHNTEHKSTRVKLK